MRSRHKAAANVHDTILARWLSVECQVLVAACFLEVDHSLFSDSETLPPRLRLLRRRGTALRGSKSAETGASLSSPLEQTKIILHHRTSGMRSFESRSPAVHSGVSRPSWACASLLPAARGEADPASRQGRQP